MIYEFLTSLKARTILCLIFLLGTFTHDPVTIILIPIENIIPETAYRVEIFSSRPNDGQKDEISIDETMLITMPMHSFFI